MDPVSTAVDLGALRGKSVLITGGASGMGLATARAWAAAGAFVTIADIQSPELGQRLAEELQANYVWCDVADWDSQVAAFKAAVTFSPSHTLDIVAAFAGTAAAPGNEVDLVLAAGEPSLAADPPAPDIRNIQVNLIGLYYTSWLALYYARLPPRASTSSPPRSAPDPAPPSPSEPRLPDKSLILVASIAAYMDAPVACTYPASKFGVRGLFRSTRARSTDLGVRCNLLAPWFADTPLIEGTRRAMAARGVEMRDAVGFVSVDKCVEAASYCAVDATVHGVALALQPEGTFDLKDDFEHGWAGDQLRPIMTRRREAGFMF